MYFVTCPWSFGLRRVKFVVIIISITRGGYYWLDDTVCLEIIRHKDGSIVSISRISEVIMFNCSSLMLWNLQLYNNSFEWKNVTSERSQNILLPFLHIFRGVRTSSPRIYALVSYPSCRRSIVGRTACEPWSIRIVNDGPPHSPGRTLEFCLGPR